MTKVFLRTWITGLNNMFGVAIIFLSAIGISLTAAYFSIIGLATMFPGSTEAIVVMGSVLEVGKLVAAVWLHKNWRTAFRFIRGYLLAAVLILCAITSMGIFGFLSRSHVEHSASIAKEEAMISQIEGKISRHVAFISRKTEVINTLDRHQLASTGNKDEVIARLEGRIDKIKEELQTNIEIEQNLLSQYDSRRKELDAALEASKPSGIFGNTKKYNDLIKQQKKERDSLLSRKLSAEEKIQSLRGTATEQIEEARRQIDVASARKEESGSGADQGSAYLDEIEETHDKIAALEEEKFKYGEALRSLEVEIGPIMYVANALRDWGGFKVEVAEAIRIVIITLIFVFDPLAILLLIAATMSYSQIKEDELPPDIRDIRNKLLEEMEEYLDEGGIAEHFIERCKK